VIKGNYEIRQLKIFLFSSFFRGESYFILKLVHDHQARFLHGEIVTGLLVPLRETDLRGAAYQALW
jgi:hypothetical protein